MNERNRENSGIIQTFRHLSRCTIENQMQTEMQQRNNCGKSVEAQR